MTEPKVYVLFGNTGEYSDHIEWVVRAYMSEAMANAERDRLNAIAGEKVERYDWEARQATIARLRQHDRQATMDYTGTDYYVAEVPLVVAQ